MTIIDANGLILGRLSSIVATRLLNGEKIDIINSEKLIISGKQATIFNEYKECVERGSTEHGPYFPKRPEMILKRTIRSMLPYKRKRGRIALSNLRVYLGIPYSLKDKNTETIQDASKTRLSKKKFVELKEISIRLGSKL